MSSEVIKFFGYNSLQSFFGKNRIKTARNQSKQIGVKRKVNPSTVKTLGKKIIPEIYKTLRFIISCVRPIVMFNLSMKH